MGLEDGGGKEKKEEKEKKGPLPKKQFITCYCEIAFWSVRLRRFFSGECFSSFTACDYRLEKRRTKPVIEQRCST